MSWAGAETAPYNNVIGIDPQLMDPENGDYGLAPTSPALGYGCQTFAKDSTGSQTPLTDSTRRRAPLKDSTGDRTSGVRPGRGLQTFSEPRSTGSERLERRSAGGEIEVSGDIAEDTVWSAAKVKVVGDVRVMNNVTLTVEPDVCVEFQGFYWLCIEGRLLAVGGPGQPILFTSDDPENFVVDRSLTGCWKGIRFLDTLETNQASRIEWCIIEYSKGLTESRYPYDYGGGAISVIDFSKLTVAHCTIRNNVGEYGGALFLYRNACPEIVNNMIVDNHALENASAAYCSYSYPTFTNNTIVNNIIHNETNPYIDSCAVENFLAKPVFVNNIVHINDPEYLYSHFQLLRNKEYHTRFNNIEDYAGPYGNIDADPLFNDPENGGYHLSRGSPCVDSGDGDAVCLPDVDIDGDARKSPGHGGLHLVGRPPHSGTGVDMGADEYCSVQKKNAAFNIK